jgi:hypothetical protein
MNIGMGAMLHYLGGGSPESPDKYINKEIKDIVFDDPNNTLQIDFTDDVSISIWDGGQSCCESRYMTCDDDVKSIIGGKLLGIEEKSEPIVTGKHHL